MADNAWRFSIGMLAAIAVLGTRPAAAQDFTAGKTPAQLFQSDCTACHKSAAGLAKGRDTRALTSFLREHYTTKAESAAALAGYLRAAGPAPAEGRPKPQAPATAGVTPNPAAKPKGVQRSEREPDPNAIAHAPAHEERRAPHPPAVGHEAAPSETDDETIRKLNTFAAAGGLADDTARSAETTKKLRSYAGAGSAADMLTPAVNAKPKAEKKKKSAPSASASPSPSSAPLGHPMRRTGPGPLVIQRPPGIN